MVLSFSIPHRIVLTAFTSFGVHSPTVPPSMPEAYEKAMTASWAQSVDDRPTFSELVDDLEEAEAQL